MRRPIALRGDTKFIPPHMLGAIVHPYVQDVPGHQMEGLKQLLHESTRQPLGLSTGSVAVFQELCKENYWRFTGMQALLRVAAQRLRCCGWLWPPKGSRYKLTPSAALQAQLGNKKWSLILPSSARVSELTYVTIIGARYPELDTVQNDIIQFGNYLQAEQCTRAGFLPIFWDAPFSYINASIDIGEVVDWITDKFVVANKGDLAVLHNRNKMVNAFANTEWVSGSGGAIISRSVHVLCWNDGLPRTACSNQSGVPQWRTREKLPPTPTARTRLPKEKRPMQGPLWPSLEHRRSVSSWVHWTCVGW